MGLKRPGRRHCIPGDVFQAGRTVVVSSSSPGITRSRFAPRNETGWERRRPEIRFAVMQGRPYLSEQEGFQRAGSCERVGAAGNGLEADRRSNRRRVPPGSKWRRGAPQRRGSVCLRSAAPRHRFPERRGILVPPARDGRFTATAARSADLPTGRSPDSWARPVVLDGSLSTDQDAEDLPELKARWSTPDVKRDVSD